MTYPPLIAFEQATQRAWFYGLSQLEWELKTQRYLEGLESYTRRGQWPRIVLTCADPVEFLAGFMAACLADCPIFLGNSRWTDAELAQALAIAKPHALWTSSEMTVTQEPLQSSSPLEKGFIMIPTGGTSGRIKFAIHTWSTLSTAVKGMQDFFLGLASDQRIHSCCLLPLYHVSGLMQFMRSLLTGGTFALVQFSMLQQGFEEDPQFQEYLASDLSWFLSLVPTQLYRLLEGHDAPQAPDNWLPDHPLHWLAKFRAILLGGAPAASHLLDRAQSVKLPLAPTYGMTETAAQVLTLKPEAFLAGSRSSGEVLPHVQMALQSGQRVGDLDVGQLRWTGESLFWGYYPDVVQDRAFLTDDIAEIGKNGTIRILGRESRKIISGGENIYPEEVEQVLMDSQKLQDVTVFSIPSAEWGEQVVAAYVAKENDAKENQDMTEAAIAESLTAWVKQNLSAFKCPKQWISLPAIPRNEQGKVDIVTLRQRCHFSGDRSLQ